MDTAVPTATPTIDELQAQLIAVKRELELVRGQRNSSNRHIEQLQDQLASMIDNGWREAVLDELVTCHIYSEKYDSDPKKALQDAIDWNVAVALDPKVSLAAKELLDTIPEKAQNVILAAAYASFCPTAGSFLEGRSVEDCFEELTYAVNQYFGTHINSPMEDYISEDELLFHLGLQHFFDSGLQK